MKFVGYPNSTMHALGTMLLHVQEKRQATEKGVTKSTGMYTWSRL